MGSEGKNDNFEGDGFHIEDAICLTPNKYLHVCLLVHQ